MSSSKKTSKKIIKSFLVIGTKEFQKYNLLTTNDQSNLSFIENINIININLPTKRDHLEIKNEKWFKILNNTNCWIRFQYESRYINPITDLILHECDSYGKDYLLLPKKLYDEGYRPVPIIYYNNAIKNIDMEYMPKIIEEQRSFQKFDSFNVLIPMNYNCKTLMNLPSKKLGVVLLINRKTKFLPLKQLIIQRRPGEKSYRFCILRHNSPYSYKYFPEIIDSYPPNENNNPSIALFCFPDGIKIKDNFETPKCFNFVLTDELGDRTYGAVLIFSQEINITLEESFIPIYSPENKKYFIQKAICVLSNLPFYYNSLLFLKELYNIIETGSNRIIPIERAICTFVDSLYLQSNDKLLRFNINNKNIDYYRIPNYGKIWDTNDKYIETLFRLLSYENIITAWEGLLLEKKLYIICSSKNVLSQIANALINLLFPLKWIHVYIPILPERLKVFLDSPVPSIIGIFFHIEINELPQDGLILNINKNCFENYKEKLPPLPSKLNKILMSKLLKLKDQYKLDNPINTESWISNQEEALIYLGPDTLLFPKIDTCEIRDAFYSFFLALFKNYEKYFPYENKIVGVENVFLRDNFLKEHNSSEANSFLFLFCDTALFNQFVDSFCIEENNINSSFAFFINSIKSGKGKNKYYLPKIIPKNVVFAPKIEIGDLNGRKFNYSEFPKLDKNLFIKSEAPSIPYRSKFLYAKDEWCFSPEKLKKKDWPKYFIYLIYDIWFTFFSFVLNTYEDNQAIIMMDYALFLVEYLNDTLKISPSRNLFSKIIKACARSSLNPFVKQILNIVKKVNKSKSKFNSLFHNEYLNGLYFLTENVNTGAISDSITNSSIFRNTMRASVIKEMKKSNNDIENKLNRIIFLTYNICESCLMKNPSITKCLFYEEILAGFIMKKPEEIKSICSNCLNYFEPKIYYIENDQHNLDMKEIAFLSPMQLVEKIDNEIKEKGELSFYKENDWSEIYWNIIFYFQLFDLPICVLYVQENMDKFEKLKNNLNQNRKRKLMKEKKEEKKPKINFLLQKLNRKNKSKEKDTMSDVSTDTTKNNNSNMSTNIFSELSFAFNGKQIFMSNTEMDIWKIYQLKKMNNKINEINNKSNNNIITEDKNEVLSNIEETKNFLKDIMIYFYHVSQDKLKIFLERYNNSKRAEKNDFVNTMLKKENDKYINQNQKEKDEFTINANLNFPIKQKDFLQMKEIEKQSKNDLNKEENKIGLNTKEKIPLDNLSGKKNNINQNNNLDKNNNRIININIILDKNKKKPINNNINKMENITNNKYKINNQLNQKDESPHNKTYSNFPFNKNKRYEIPKIKHNEKLLNTPERNINRIIDIKAQNNKNNPKKKCYTVRQVNAYKSIYDNDQNKNI